MSLVMTASEFAEAYPNGMDDDDLAAWNHAVEKSCDHGDAIEVAEQIGRDRLYCPTCGVEVSASAIRAEWEAEAEMEAERRIGA